MPVENISFSDIDFQSEEGFYISVTKNVEFHDVSVTTKMGSSFEFLNSENIVLDNIESENPLKNTPVIKIENIANIVVRNTAMFMPFDLFLSVSGEKTKNVYLRGNILPKANKISEMGKEISNDVIITNKN